MQKSLKRRSHVAPAEKARLVEAFRTTHLPAKEFAAQHGIGESTLYRWLQQDRQVGGAADPRPAPALIQVPNLFAERPGASPYRLRLPGGQVLEVARGFELGEVRALAQLLHSLC